MPSLECSTATRSPKRSSKRRVVCGVSAISGTSTIAERPCSSASRSGAQVDLGLPAPGDAVQQERLVPALRAAASSTASQRLPPGTPSGPGPRRSDRGRRAPLDVRRPALDRRGAAIDTRPRLRGPSARRGRSACSAAGRRPGPGRRPAPRARRAGADRAAARPAAAPVAPPGSARRRAAPAPGRRARSCPCRYRAAARARGRAPASSSRRRRPTARARRAPAGRRPPGIRAAPRAARGQLARRRHLHDQPMDPPAPERHDEQRTDPDPVHPAVGSGSRTARAAHGPS